MYEARIELLQRMPVFGGIRADVLQFLLGLCSVVSVQTNEYFFREHDQADSMFVLEAGKVAVLKSWRGQEYLAVHLSMPRHVRRPRGKSRHRDSSETLKALI